MVNDVILWSGLISMSFRLNVWQNLPLYMSLSSIGTLILGVEYSSTPTPHLKPALLNASEASPFSFSIFDSTPQSDLLIHSFVFGSLTEIVQNKLPLISLYEHCQLNCPNVSSNMAASVLAVLYNSNCATLFWVEATLTSISSFLKFLISIFIFFSFLILDIGGNISKHENNAALYVLL